jgi:hypothetical protein
MLVRAADVRRDDLEYDSVIDRLSRRIRESGIIDVLHRDFAWSKIDDATIGRHL